MPPAAAPAITPAFDEPEEAEEEAAGFEEEDSVVLVGLAVPDVEVEVPALATINCPGCISGVSKDPRG